ncbi:membrane protein insertion efficiency factor YidD, partial [Candidatus Parcubacteria bacterium]|nr:membrane protein insertion efficiency factor YidD [Candidatus Parcubacteria bacterium]
MKNFLIKIIKIYQKTLSPDHGFFRFLRPHGFCRFSPTCSEYSIQALTKHGAVKGIIKSIWRVIRCNPWNKGGYDP